MKSTTQNNPTLVGALLGVIVAGQAMAVDLRYQNSGDYFDTVAVTGSYGWQNGGGGPDGLPGTGDTARANWGNNTITLSAEAPLLRNFQLGVDESGQLIVNAGGKLNTTGTQNSTVGNNGGAGVIGRLTINAGGEVNITNVLFVGHNATGILTNDGGILNISSHLWAGSAGLGIGTISILNGGVVNVGGNIGLGTIDASAPSGGKASISVEEGGVLNLANISPGTSIQPNSVLDISGSGIVTVTGDRVADMSAYTNALKITAYGGLGTVGIDYNNTNAGKTTLWAIAPTQPPPTETVWNPAGNPAGTGKWNESANWTGSVAPGTPTKVIFNVPDAITCTITNAAQADYVVMGDNGPGGTLNIASGGSLTCGSVNATAIGYNSNGVLVVEAGATATFGLHLWIGLDPGSDGTLIMNGGTVTVNGMFGLGWQGGKGAAQINAGTLNLAQWDYFNSIQGDSVLDVTGTGKVVINGNQVDSINNFIITGQITNHAGPGMVAVDYNNINIDKTTIYPADLYLPPAQATWNPALAFPNTDGLWNMSSNWSGGIMPSNVTFVYLNIPDALPCVVNSAAFANVVRIGLNGPGGTMIITNGGNLVTSHPDEWNSVGMNNTGLLVVENGGSATYGQHLWIGFEPGADGTLTMNGGTVTVNGMFGLGWNGGTGHANINGGTLNLNQLSATDSIKGASVLNVAGSGKVVINGNHVTAIANYIAAGKITANGGIVYYSYDPGANKTTISAVLLPAPRQSITDISVEGGNVSITYQTTDQHTYYIEGTPSLSPAVWTPVTGSTNPATGAPVTFVFPAAPGQHFYRTVAY
ncbi:MAG TPA: hypothetical protein VFZ59_19645 [Verrucomicrobiae bacterium]|nr:hypothetical protein [Verrucomicrobiae bacterium]